MSAAGAQNIAAHLPAMAARQPYRLAVLVPAGHDRLGRARHTHYTFGQLNEVSDRIARGLLRRGIGRGTRAVLMVPPSLEFFALTFALFKAGAVPVLVDPGMGIRNLGTCLAEAQPEAFIGIPKAQLARVLLGWSRRTIQSKVTVGRSLFSLGPTLEEIERQGAADANAAPLADVDADETAAILFTSGSTGVPKGAIYTHGIFAAQVELLKRTYGIQPGEIDLCTFPLFALFAPALGMTAVVPDMDATRPGQADPRKIIGAIEDFGATNMFGSPALLTRVGRHGHEQGIKLPTLRRVISAGAPVYAQVLEWFSSMLQPPAEIFTPYGATESLPVSSIGSGEILAETAARTAEGAGVCVGRPVEGMQVAIIKISDEPIECWSEDLCLPDGQIGEITVRGPVVTQAYFNRPESTALAKIADPAGGVRHRMGDLGYFDEQGRLWFCGRKAHRVVTADETLYTVPCEAIFNNHPRVRRTALVGVPSRKAQQPVLCVELEPGAAGNSTKELTSQLLGLGAAHAHTRAIRTILYHPSFPVDIRHNSKIFREQLALWAQHQLTHNTGQV